jgi:hypothetical protein
MLVPVLLLTAWFIYVEVEMPDRRIQKGIKVEQVEDDNS